MFTIYWCFKDELAETKIGIARMAQAWAVWTDVIGTASPKNQHALEFVQWKPATGEREDGMPPATVIVAWDPDLNGGAASPAYMGKDCNTHFIKVGPTLPEERGLVDLHPTWVLAHELGHVFGLLHEHQRPDRDTFIRYRPENVVGFQAAKREAEIRGYTLQQLLDSVGVNIECGWRPVAQYIKWSHAPDNQTPYDLGSIMHYDSGHHCKGYTDKPGLPLGPHPLTVPMSKIGPNGVEVLFLHSARVPADSEPPPKFYISQGDAAAIRLMYPHY
jgi:hypothetical protein